MLPFEKADFCESCENCEQLLEWLSAIDRQKLSFFAIIRFATDREFTDAVGSKEEVNDRLFVTPLLFISPI